MTSKTTRAPLFFVLLVMLAPVAVSAFDELAVPVDDPVYEVIRVAELRGTVARLSAVRPYTRSRILTLLDAVLADGARFSDHEREVVQRHYDRLAPPEESGPVELALVPERGQLVYSDGGDRQVAIGVRFRSNNMLDFTNVEAFHTNNIMDFTVLGTLFPFMSFAGNLGFSFDAPNPEAFAPYAFSKTWDRFHMLAEIRNTEVQGSLFSMVLGTDLAFSFLDDDLILRFSRFRRDWGYGNGNLSMSETARPFLALEGSARLAPWLNIAHLNGTLAWAGNEAGGSRTREPAVPDERGVTHFKSFALQTFELFPLDWLYMYATGSVVYAKYFELGYLSPLLYNIIYQNVIGDLDNAGVEIGGALTIAPFLRLHGALFVDEMEITTLELIFTRPRNMFAYQLGAQGDLPFLPLTTLQFQYTKIEPFVYSHYDTGYPNFFALVDTTYTNDGENLGFRLPPNSDEFLVRLESLGLPGLRAGLEWRLIRHGTNDPDLVGDLAIFGDVAIEMDYRRLNAYPDKNFLFDGFYDWNNLISIDADYRFEQIPLSIQGRYTLAHTFYRANASGIPEPDPVTRHILGLSVSFWY